MPSDLVKAVAWHESGWQSNIVNCDGGRGLMQVMPDTEEFVNSRFEKSYDAHDYQQNATLGANYLAWLTKYFGDNYFKGNYSLSTSKCKSHQQPVPAQPGDRRLQRRSGDGRRGVRGQEPAEPGVRELGPLT